MKEKSRKLIKYSLSLILAIVLMYFCFKGVKWEDFWNGLKECRWGWVLLSIAIGLVSNWFRSERWKQLLLPVDEKTDSMTVFNAVNIGYLANFVFPRIGEFVRCGVISKKSKKASYDKVVGTMVTERSFDILVLLVLILVFVAIKWEEFGAFFRDHIWLPMSAKLNFSIWWIVAISVLLVAVLVFVTFRFADRSPVLRKISSIFSGLWTGVISCIRMDARKQLLFHLHTILLWISYLLTSYTVMRAIPALDCLGWADAMFLMLVGSVGWVVPVPGGFGAFHYIVSLAVQTVYAPVYGLSFTLGLFFATLSHESQSVMMIVTGLFSYIYEMVKKPVSAKSEN